MTNAGLYIDNEWPSALHIIITTIIIITTTTIIIIIILVILTIILLLVTLHFFSCRCRPLGWSSAPTPFSTT
jgi:hypothetical protein